MPPVWPPAVALALLKPTEPKLASDRVWQLPDESQTDGASAIHSALEVSALGTSTVLVACWPVVWSLSVRVNVEPLTLTLAESLSPGWTAMPSLTWPAGTISYQA
jgi:hypothetical protein